MSKTVRTIRGLALSGVAALGLIALTPAFADSEFVSGGGAISANADLNFRVTVPRFIDFQVGAASGVDEVAFTVPAADIGDGNAINAASPIPVRLRSNAGNITLAASSATTGLTAAGLDPILWSEISGTSSEATDLPVPAVGGSVNLSATSGIINRTADWSFAFENNNLVGAGVYTGTVTYTASAP